jgi:hypothetical protein
MKPESRWSGLARAVALAAGLAAGLALTGCGMPGAPQPPSLNLPDPVVNLSAVRTGDQVALAWTMPRKNTDKLLIEGDISVRVCREAAQEACAAAGELKLAPGAQGAFTDTLPAALAAGAPRALRYFVELPNRRGRSAGLSNVAVVVAGEAPAAVTGLSAEVGKAGVTLRWARAAGSAPAAVRLRRTLLTPEAAKPQQGLLAPAAEPVERSFLVEAGDEALTRALDKSVRFGAAYAYRAQRVARVEVDGTAVELDGPLSASLRVEVKDVFPPAVPSGLAAVATAAGENAKASIDLSWQPDTETDLAGYGVYRREGQGDWRRISGAQPVTGPAFHDAEAEAGHTYRYAVTAIDQGGHESARSPEAEETVPQP